ncbi:MAG TPA: DNA modification methylase, partial [Anaerolineaceae bacterium]|nr:DNA modification methylase [Anaerolineaceae bacterium]
GKFANRIVGSGEESLDQIQFNPRNWRVHPLNQQNALKGVLEEVGWVQEVIVNKRTGNLIDGHLRCQLAAREGAKTIPVKYVDLSEDEEALVLSTLDPIAAMAVTDKQKLDDLFASIETENADVLKMLDDIAEKERLEYAKRDPVDAEPQIDRAAELNEKWQVVTGDLWQIGEHRLLCGDSTKREDVERVTGGENAVLMLTDPPYGVDYGELVRSRVNQKKDGWNDIENDALSDDDLYTLLLNSLSGCGAVTGFVWHPPGARRWLFWKAVEENGWRVSQEIVWVKNSMVFGRSDYQWRHEPCLYLKREGSKKQEDRTQTTVWEVDKPTNSIHPTMKPVELFEIAVRNHTQEGDITYEPFCGSGTTMVACQNLNRKCRAIEISPNYCAVILERMSTAFPELE